MKTTIFPSQSKGKLSIIGSKSVTHRALICAALSEKESIINNVSLNDDIFRTLEALKQIGAQITCENDKIIVAGIDRNQCHDQLVINAHESGSTLRFLIPIATQFAKEVVFIGSETLLSRPLSVYEELFKQEGLYYDHQKDQLVIKGALKATDYQVAGDISSQFISGLLMMMPLLNEPSQIILTTALQSKPYVDMTLDMMKQFQVDVSPDLKVDTNQSYTSTIVNIEGDYSQAAFFAVLGAINNDLTITNLNPHSKQGDRYIFKILEDLGVKVEYGEHDVKVYKSNIKSGVIDLKDTPDLGPILFVLALFSESSLRLKNIERLKIKESNRLEAMITELKKFGAKLEVIDNDILIHRLEHFNRVDEVESYNDHRIVMALSILATTLDYPLTINQSEAINKSYPRFYEDLEQLNIKIERE